MDCWQVWSEEVLLQYDYMLYSSTHTDLAATLGEINCGHLIEVKKQQNPHRDIITSRPIRSGRLVGFRLYF